MSDIACLYRIEIEGSEEFYIGSSKDFKHRVSAHQSRLNKGLHDNKRLQTHHSAGKKLTFNILDIGTRDEMYALEQVFITENIDNPDMLNVGLSVKGGDNLTRNPDRDSILKKMVDGIVRRYDEMSTEERAHLSDRMMGDKNPMFGKTHTAEAREKIAAVHRGNTRSRGRKLSEEHKGLISEHAKLRVGEKNPFHGKRHSEETKSKMSELKKGNLPTNSNSIEIDGVVYASQAIASRELGVSAATITFRIKSNNPKYNGYRVIKTDGV